MLPDEGLRQETRVFTRVALWWNRVRIVPHVWVELRETLLTCTTACKMNRATELWSVTDVFSKCSKVKLPICDKSQRPGGQSARSLLIRDKNNPARTLRVGLLERSLSCSLHEP